MSHSKQALRERILQQRKNLSDSDIQTASQLIFQRLQPLIADKQHIMIFMDMDKEIPLSRLPETHPEKTYYIPKAFPQGQMGISLYQPDTLEKTPKGYRESTSDVYYPLNNIELIIVPGNVFDLQKNRIGYGAGYYDRFLKRANALNIPHCAVCYDFQIIAKLPEEAHDIKMMNIISEKRML